MNIQWSQVILISALIIFGAYAFRLRSLWIDRLIYLALAAIGIGFILFPDISTLLANRLGIGRGADLIFYLFMTAAMFYVVTAASTIRSIQRQITLLTRALALRSPQQANGDVEADNEGGHEQYPHT